MIPRCAVLFVVPGRLMSKRRSGQKLVFYDLEGQGGHLQLMALANKHQPTPGSRLSLSRSRSAFSLSSQFLNSSSWASASHQVGNCRLKKSFDSCTTTSCDEATSWVRSRPRSHSHSRAWLGGIEPRLTGIGRFKPTARVCAGTVVDGYPTRTKSGELSIVPRSVQLASPCLHQLPEPNSFTNPV